MKKSMGKTLLVCALAAGSLSLTGCGIESITGGGGGGGGGFGIGNIGGLISGLLKFVPQIGGGGRVLATGGPAGTPLAGPGQPTGLPNIPGLPDFTQWPTTKTATEIGGPDVAPSWREGEAEPLVPGPVQGTYDQDPWAFDYPTSGDAGRGGGSWNEGEPEPFVQTPYEPMDGSEV